MNEEMRTRIVESVKRGVALLDEKVPDWRSKIDLATLDMNDTDHCVVGQVTGDFFYTGMKRLFPATTPSTNWAAATEHGFYIPDDKVADTTEQHEALRDEWRKVIGSGQQGGT
jgi:hypothetical protein